MAAAVGRTRSTATPSARWYAQSVSIATHTERVATTAVLLPHDHDGSPLPVLLDPYGGPHAQRVVRSHNMFCTSQWFADQGFAVVVIDGRGTPGVGAASNARS